MSVLFPTIDVTCPPLQARNPSTGAQMLLLRQKKFVSFFPISSLALLPLTLSCFPSRPGRTIRPFSHISNVFQPSAFAISGCIPIPSLANLPASLIFFPLSNLVNSSSPSAFSRMDAYLGAFCSIWTSFSTSAIPLFDEARLSFSC